MFTQNLIEAAGHSAVIQMSAVRIDHKRSQAFTVIVIIPTISSAVYLGFFTVANDMRIRAKRMQLSDGFCDRVETTVFQSEKNPVGRSRWIFETFVLDCTDDFEHGSIFPFLGTEIELRQSRHYCLLLSRFINPNFRAGTFYLI